MCACVTNACDRRIRLRGGSAVISPRSKRSARRSSRNSRYRPGSPNAPLMSRGSKRWRTGVSGGDGGRPASVTRSSEPLAELDVVAVRIADLGPRVLLACLRPPHRLDAFRSEVVERALHVLDLERHHPVAEA